METCSTPRDWFSRLTPFHLGEGTSLVMPRCSTCCYCYYSCFSCYFCYSYPGSSNRGMPSRPWLPLPHLVHQEHRSHRLHGHCREGHSETCQSIQLLKLSTILFNLLDHFPNLLFDLDDHPNQGVLDRLEYPRLPLGHQ